MAEEEHDVDDAQQAEVPGPSQQHPPAGARDAGDPSLVGHDERLDDEGAEDDPAVRRGDT